jgi:agmatine/peptidylarginine deiminase
MLTWPHPDTDWGERLTEVYPVFAEIGRAVTEHESLLSVCCSRAHAAEVHSRLLAAGAATRRLLFCLAPSNDSWARDHGPLTTLAAGQATLHDFVFNGWGRKFAPRLDSAISGRLHQQQVFPGSKMRAHDFVLEGGAVETDGNGTLLATRSSIIGETRNPGHDQSMVERQLHERLGLKRFLWLTHGAISGDDTDGHIDTLARFADPQTILYTTAPVGDRDHSGLAAMEQELKGLRTPSGRHYRLLRLPFAGVHEDPTGRRLPASYANFLIINGAVLLPSYGVVQDSEAASIVQGAFPGRKVVAIDCSEIIRQNGSLHCLTMQFPAQLALRDGLDSPNA